MPSRISIVVADITTLEVDAIVNSANKSLLGGGGVDGAIHYVAGRALLKACKKLKGCNTGEAKITQGFALPSKYIIHTVGPVWDGGDKNEVNLLSSCYSNSLNLAVEYECQSIAFSSTSTGVYGFPPEKAAMVAVETVAKFLQADKRLSSVVFCCFTEESAEYHRLALRQYISGFGSTPV